MPALPDADATANLFNRDAPAAFAGKLRVAGTCVLDVRVGPVPLNRPLNEQAVRTVDPPTESVGGVVGNVGMQLAQLGLPLSVATQIGDDAWGHTIREQLTDGGMDLTHLALLPNTPSGVAFCMVGDEDSGADRVFMTSPGPHRQLEADWLQTHTKDLGPGDVLVLGYFSRLPKLTHALPAICKDLGDRGVRIAMDAAGDGGGAEGMAVMAACLPHLWLYAPSRHEAEMQTGTTDIQAMLDAYRKMSPKPLLVIKDGEEGAWLDGWGVRCHQPALLPPGPVVDTVGAGDAFVAGLVAALLAGSGPAVGTSEIERLKQVGRLAAANAAWSVADSGGWRNGLDWPGLLDWAGRTPALLDADGKRPLAAEGAGDLNRL